MKYEVMFYVGMALTIVFLIITIIAFFKCNVVEIIYDLLGIKRNTKLKKTKKSKADNENVKVKKMDSIQIRSKAAIDEKENTREYEIEESMEEEKTALFQEYADKIEEYEEEDLPSYKSASLLGDDIRLQNEEEDTGILNEEDTGILNEEDTGILNEEDTGILNEEDTGILNEEDTGILNEENTGILNEEDTGILNEEDTGILNEEDTGILNEEVAMTEESDEGFSDAFTKEIDITIIHTDKVI